MRLYQIVMKERERKRSWIRPRGSEAGFGAQVPCASRKVKNVFYELAMEMQAFKRAGSVHLTLC